MLDFLSDLFFGIDVYLIALRGFLSNAVVALFVALLLWPLARRLVREAKSETDVPIFLSLFILAVFGALVGYSGGNSRVGVVGDVVPAVITFIAGLLTYLIGFREKEINPLTLPVVFAFLLTLFFCYVLGATNRVGHERGERTRVTCIENYSNPATLGDAEAYHRMREVFDTFCASRLRLDLEDG